MDFLWRLRARRFALFFLNEIKKGQKVIDVGAGNGYISEILARKKIKVTPIDIKDYNKTNLRLKLYNGKKIPFKNTSFDWALLISVLHHSSDPIQVLKETKRVAKKIIIIEDVYTNWWDKFWLKFNDFLFNVPFGQKIGQNFHTDNQWKKIFKKLNLKFKKEYMFKSSLGLVKLKIYFL